MIVKNEELLSFASILGKIVGKIDKCSDDFSRSERIMGVMLIAEREIDEVA